MPKRTLNGHKDHINTFYCMAVLWSLIWFFCFIEAFEAQPPYSEGLDTKEQVVGVHHSRKYNLQHAYAQRVAIFHVKCRFVS